MFPSSNPYFKRRSLILQTLKVCCSPVMCSLQLEQSFTLIYAIPRWHQDEKDWIYRNFNVCLLIIYLCPLRDFTECNLLYFFLDIALRAELKK
jgi:hypothetical protein